MVETEIPDSNAHALLTPKAAIQMICLPYISIMIPGDSVSLFLPSYDGQASEPKNNMH